MHQLMAATMERCVQDIRAIQAAARKSGKATRARWPMIVLRSPKGWTGPKKVGGKTVEGYWRAHQVPMADVRDNPENLKLLEKWMKSYRPQELFDADGRLIEELRALAPKGRRRMSANPHANGGQLRRALRLPDFRDYAVPVKKPGVPEVENTRKLGEFLRDILKLNTDNFRVFGPDETTSNKLDAVYQVSKKTWLADYLPVDADGGELAPDGRVMEMLSEHTLEGWLEGYLLTGRHGFFSTYEAFVHVIDSMFNQHAKWLDICEDLPWRAPVASLNMLITSTVWRQDHNGFTHQDPGFLDVVVNKSPRVTRIYLPPDSNCLMSVADHCLRSTDDINVIVCDKQKHLQFLDMDAAIKHCTKGIGIWDWASNDQGTEPDVVMASCGDIATQEALAATVLLRQHFPDLRIRFVNVVDLYRLTPPKEHPHGLSDRDFDTLFTTDKPIIFNFHGYPWLIHRLSYRRTNHRNLHVRGYKEKGNINTPLELAINNEVDRFSLAIDAIDRVPRLQVAGAHVKEKLRNLQIECRAYAHEHGIDRAAERDWKWPL
jgi:xylulose-5-phosphate/fructose-6-phosphate phosphoketolase